VKVLLACWDLGLNYQGDTEPDEKALPWKKYNGLVAISPLASWDSARKAITSAAGQYAPGFYDELGLLKKCARDTARRPGRTSFTTG
jgi:hypothetical protein